MEAGARRRSNYRRIFPVIMGLVVPGKKLKRVIASHVEGSAVAIYCEN